MKPTLKTSGSYWHNTSPSSDPRSRERRSSDPLIPRAESRLGSGPSILRRTTSTDFDFESGLSNDNSLDFDEQNESQYPIALGRPGDEGVEHDWLRGMNNREPCLLPLAPGQRLTQKQADYLNGLMRTDWRPHGGFINPDQTRGLLKPAFQVGITQPNNFADWMKDRASQYAENPLSVMKAAANMMLYGITGMVMASTVLGAFLTVGVSSSVIATVTTPALAVAAIWGASLGFYNDFVLDKPLIEKDFNWMDGMPQSACLNAFNYKAS